MLTNGGSLQDAINAQLGSAKETGKSIWGNMGDWWETTKGVYGDTINFWEQFYANLANSMFGPADQDYLDFEEELRKRIQEDMQNMPQGWDTIFGEPEVTVVPKPEENAAEKISQDVGVVDIRANIVPWFFAGGYGHLTGGGAPMGLGSLGGESMRPVIGNANGLPMVPWDGYPAILHKGERVVTAREVNNSRNFSSNLYVENMNMNGGVDAAGLAAAMAAAQRRTMRGYGS